LGRIKNIFFKDNIKNLLTMNPSHYTNTHKINSHSRR